MTLPIGGSGKIQLNFLSDPRFGYVEHISLRDATTNEETNILTLTAVAANELVARHGHITSNERNRQSLIGLEKSIDRDDFSALKKSHIPFDVFVRRASPSRVLRSVSSDFTHSVERLMESAESLADFRQAISNLAEQLRSENAEIQLRPVNAKIAAFTGSVETIPKYVYTILKMVTNVTVLYLTERRRGIGREEANRLLELKVTRGGQEKLQQIQETVETLLGVSIDAFRGAATSRDGAELDVDNFLVEVNGAGIREALRLILDYEFKRPQILLIEEPEVHLHPALESSMLRYLRQVSEQCQVFVATHSTNFLDAAEPHGIFLVSKGRPGATSVLHLHEPDDVESLIPPELGIRLSSLFMYEQLVLVEGSSDEDAFREWAATLQVNLGLHSVGFLPIGGVGNLRYFAAEQLLSFLSKRRVRLWVVIDRDEKDDVQLQKIVKQLADRAELVVLERRELENYFLEETIIWKFVCLKRRLGSLHESGDPTPVSIVLPVPFNDAITADFVQAL